MTYKIDVNNIGYEETVREKNLNGILFNEVATDIFCTKVFFLLIQRTAWHSTKISRYNSGTPFFMNKKDAKDRAESLRVRGSYFVISEMPAIIIESNESMVVLIQINTDTPFKDYSVNALSAHTNTSRRLYGYLNSYFHIGVNIGELIQTFRWNSNFWRVNQPEKNSILVSLHWNEKKSYKKYCSLPQKVPLKNHISYSNGSKYYLGWNEEGNDIKSSYTHKIIKRSKEPDKEASKVICINSARKRKEYIT